MRLDTDGTLSPCDPDDYTAVCDAIDGWLTTTSTRVAGWSAFCDDEGLLKPGMVVNVAATHLIGCEIRGPVVVFKHGLEGACLPLSATEVAALTRFVAETLAAVDAFLATQPAA